MTINNINTLSSPTINGLSNLTLDELTAETIYLSILETNHIEIDNTLILNNGSVIVSDGTNVSNIEVSYLNGVTSNIQTQFINSNVNISNIQSQITANDNDIINLQGQITGNDTDILNLQILTNDISLNNINLQNQIIGNDTDILNLQILTNDIGFNNTNLQGQITDNDTDILDLQILTNNISGNMANIQVQIIDNDNAITNINSEIIIINNNVSGFYKYNDYQGLSKPVVCIDAGISINLLGENSYFKIGKAGSIRMGIGSFISFNNSFDETNIQEQAFTNLLKSDIVNNKTDISNNKIDISNNKINISNNKIDIGNNKINISNNNANIVTLNNKTTNLDYTGDSTFISGILETNHITTQRIEFPIDNTSQYSAFTNAYKSTLDAYNAIQPGIIYNYHNFFNTTETGTSVVGVLTFNSGPMAKLIDTAGTTKMFANKIYCISATMNVENLRFLYRFEYKIRLLRNSTLIGESVSNQNNKVIYNGSSGAEFENYTLVTSPYYFKCLANYTGEIRIEYVIMHGMDTNNGTTIQFNANANLHQVN